jgi:hypothetical protein
MRKVFLALTEEEVFIVLGVRLMYSGYPFHRTSKRALGSHKNAAGEAVWERLLALRDTARGRVASEGLVKMADAPFVFLPLTEEERCVYVEMTQACLHECGEDEVDVRLHLSDSGRGAVQRVLDKLQQVE